MQSMVINSFYSEFEEEEDDDNLISLDDVNLVKSGIIKGFDYRAYQNSFADEDKEWTKKISYGLNNPDKFLSYINDMWR